MRLRLIIALIGYRILIGQVALATAVERAVMFKSVDGASLAGTLQLPSGNGPSPAMLLIAGSGPTDRDGNQPPALKTDLLKQVAQALADHGVASLRFDKRGMNANAYDLPKDKSQYGNFFSWEHFTDDAVAGFDFLRQQPEVNATRVGILGHSEGGLLALQSAGELKSQGHSPAVLILISTPGRTMDVILAEQLKRLLKSQNATPAQNHYFVGENMRICQAIIQTGKVPNDVPPGLAALYPSYLGTFLHSEMALDPCKLAAEFSGPVLIIAGSADVQVSSDRDAKALDTALANRKPDVHALVIIAKASHNLKIVSTDKDAGFEGPVAPEALEQLQHWVASHL